MNYFLPSNLNIYFLFLDSDQTVANLIVNKALHYINGNYKELTLSENVVLFVRLYQDSTEEEFSEILKYSINEDFQKFISIKTNVDDMCIISCTNYIIL